MEENDKQLYMSYNGLARRPAIWGIPYMVGLFVVTFFVLTGLFLNAMIGPAGWIFSLLAIPILIFVKIICVNDDRAVEIVLLEAKWFAIKAFSGNAKYFGGLLTFNPISYGRRLKNVKRYFEKTTGG